MLTSSTIAKILRLTVVSVMFAAMWLVAPATNAHALAYLDQAGSPSERVVDPIRVDAGWLTAYDHRSERSQNFAIHRIGRVSTSRS